MKTCSPPALKLEWSIYPEQFIICLIPAKDSSSLDSKGDGFTGFVHQVVIEQYLSNHDSPEDIEVYFCGPPLMNQAVEKMAEDFGVPPENVRFDDFGG